ncbi:hypothetical protein E1A91_A06G142500v1 [Gossypium mustelinum]|uniref:Uncharacterized protein n=1 Tax=Gossypium mustelinum TaxID=34275 RepID=A0A5D2YWP2_GOSMU|nr:hypothetical protein E1A91_A06G142500v1 [Gossypium mustelinum]
MLLNPPISSFSLQPKRPSSAHSIAAVASGRRCGERAFKLHLQRPSRRLNLQQPKSEEKGSSLSLCRTRLQRWRNHSDGEIERDSGTGCAGAWREAYGGARGCRMEALRLNMGAAQEERGVT